MRTLPLVVALVVSFAAVASQAAAKVQLPCESSYQMLSPTGTQAVVLCKDKSVHQVNLPDGTKRLLFPGDRRVSELSYSQDGQWLAAGFHDGTVEVISSQGTAATRRWKADSNRIDILYFFPDAKKLVVGAMNNPGAIWELSETPTLLATLAEEFGGVPAVAVSPDSKLLVAAGGDTVLRWYDTATWQKTREYNAFLLDTFALTFTPDGRYLLAGGADSRITVFDVASGKELRQLPPQAGSSVASIALLGDHQEAVTYYFDNAGEKRPFRLMWNLTTGKSTPVQSDFRPTCGRIVDGELWLCNTDGRTLTITQRQ
jgi:WD40 repeat protein